MSEFYIPTDIDVLKIDLDFLLEANMGGLTIIQEEQEKWFW